MSPSKQSNADLLDYVVCPCGPWNGRNSESSAVQLKDGRLLLAWSHWTSASAHDQASAEIRAKMSEDQGASWSDSFLLQGAGHYRAVEDPSLAWLPSGELGLTYFARLAEKHEGYEKEGHPQRPPSTPAQLRHLEGQGKHMGALQES